ncbi:hypothetical protein V6N13_114856 [Hibiscus sabdariffa]|uniref:Uncharacterized protein n=1 Tax=Hibiscus sabdariffa TaxID=183260 RepID=A0ABR2U338_9ROSI
MRCQLQMASTLQVHVANSKWRPPFKYMLPTPNGVHPSSTCCQLQMASSFCKPAESEPLERGSRLLQAANAILKWRQTHK